MCRHAGASPATENRAMNLTQYALMTFRTTGFGADAAEYFERAARTGDDRPKSRHEASRVLQFCRRVLAATPVALPGETGEGNDLWCEAEEVAHAMGQHIRAFDAA